MTTTDRPRFSYRAVMWSGDGPALKTDESTAFRYEVRDERGAEVGFVNTDRARSHPDVKWQISRSYPNGTIDELAGKYDTVEEAVIALEREIAKSRWTVS